ncbi:MAG: hypothetical protein WBM62_13555 [Crocosphaera sp.]
MNPSEIEICEPNFHSFIFKNRINSEHKFNKIIEEYNDVIKQLADDYPDVEITITNQKIKVLQARQEAAYNTVISQKHNNRQLLIDLKTNSDSYTLIFDQFIQEETDKIQLKTLKEFNPNHCFQNIDKNWKEQELLGKTFIFTALLPPNITQENYRKIADHCLHYLLDKPLQEIDNDFYQQGEIFNSKIFEYGKPKTDKFHALVIFFWDKNSSNKFEEIYWELDKLLLYHHKIISTYQKRDKLYHELSQQIIEIEKVAQEKEQYFNNKIITTTEINSSIDTQQYQNNPQTDKIELELKNYKKDLKNLLNLSLKYSRKLRDLEHYQNTIDINGYNYEVKLNQFKNKTGNDLTFFTKFRDEEYKTFQKQIQGDITYCHQGTVILNQSIESIRGLIEIQQVESDRQLNITIAVLGAGIGVSGLIATSYPLIEQNGPLLAPKLDRPLHPFSLSMISSLVGGVIFALIVFLIMTKYLKCQDKNSRQ